MKKNQMSVMPVALAMVMSLVTQPAWAVLGTQDNASGIDPSTLQQQAPGCQATCDLIVTSTSDGAYSTRGLEKVSSPKGDRGWNGRGNSDKETGVDDQWCANHGQQTSVTVAAKESEKPTLTEIQGRPCNVKVSQFDKAHGMSCSEVNNNLLRCMMRNSQIETQCLARATAKVGKGSQENVAFLDGLAAGMCGAVCAGQFAGPLGALAGTAGRVACTSTTVAASLGELKETYKLLKDPGLEAILQGAATATGGITGVATTTVGSANNANACAAAVAFAALTGLRYKHMRDYDKTINAACDAAKNLFSNAIAQGGSNGSGLPPGVTVPAGSSGFAGLSGSGGSQSDTNGNSDSDSDGSESTIPAGCSQLNGLDCFGAATAADGRLLRESGLEQALLPELAKLTKGDLRKALAGGSGGLISAATGGGGIGSDLSKVAALGESHGGPDLGGSNVPAAMMASAGGGGGGGGKAAGGSEGGGLFGGLFGGGSTAQGPSPASLNYGAGLQNNDIFHAGTSQNLFQIVSGKIEKVQARVGK